MKKLTKYSIILLSLILAILFFKFILYPSHLSVVSACNPCYFEEKYSDRYYTAGSFNVNFTENNESELEENLTIILVDQDNPTLMHERTHLWQYEHGLGWMLSCDITGFKLISEIQAYSVQRFYEIKEFLF